MSLMPIWLGTKRQAEFWVELGEWLEGVDAGRRLLDAEDGMGTSTTTTTATKTAAKTRLAPMNGIKTKSLMNGAPNGIHV